MHLRSTLTLLTCLFALNASLAAEKPNVLIILADDLGYSDLSCYGGEIQTPHIDALASNGAKFTQLYNSARCCPSRASLMTGLYPSQAGIGDFTTGKPNRTRGPGYIGRLNDQCATLAEVLKPTGYATYYVGKWHLHEETGPIKRGFDEFYGYTKGHSHDQYDKDYYIRLPKWRRMEIDPEAKDYYATDVFNEYALEFLKQGQKTGKPWFLFLGHSSPHFPVQAPSSSADRFDEIYERGWDALREERYSRMRQIGLINGDHWQLSPRSLVPYDKPDIANGYQGQPNPAWKDLSDPVRKDLARRMAVFAAMVDHVDQGIGRITSHLKKTGQLDNTLILFLSDNGACYEWGPLGFDGRSRLGTTTLHEGEDLKKIGQPGTHQSYGSAWANLGNTPFRLYKHFTHEGGISTPFIAHWPKGFAKHKDWVRTPAHVMDIMPTIIDATGATYPKTVNGNEVRPMEGQSLLPLLHNQSIPDRALGFDHQGARAFRKGDWKIVWSKRMPFEIEWELYNLAEDRCEMNNLAKAQPKRVKQMAKEWEQWARRVQVIWEGEPAAAVKPTKDQSPRIKNKALTISAQVTTATDRTGVIVAQGGNQHGYALHLMNGKPVFDVRVNGNVTRIEGTTDVPETFHIKATLTKATMELFLNRKSIAKATSPGLIPTQPQDGLDKGEDLRTAAGNYQAPNPLNAKITKVKID